jgi:hypothetical protein
MDKTYEQPDVFPQPSHTKHAPDIRIFTPHVIQSGASDLIPIDSRRSDDEPIARSSGAGSIFTSTAFGAAATGATAATTAFGVSTLAGVASCVYSPVSSARARSEDVNNPIAER